MDALPRTDLTLADPALGPLPAYRARLQEGALAADPAQAQVAENLQELWFRLRGYDPQPATAAKPGLFGRLLRRRGAEDGVLSAPMGLYIVG
ncbi:MAG: hypothetical protein NTW56_21130, partial [Alphaproteobacteria bacterium]|nr:hypothetical protein [Alphaproteobacteria bacterium]